MKILFLLRNLNIGGAERQSIELAKVLSNNGHKVYITTFYPSGLMETELTNTKITLNCMNKKSRWDVFGFLFNLIQHVRRLNPDVIHGYLVVPNILAAFSKLFNLNTAVIFGLRAGKRNTSNYDCLERFAFWVEPWAAHLADLVITNSYSGKKAAIERGFRSTLITVIPNGINTDVYKISPLDGKKMKLELGATDISRKWVGLVARLHPIKDHPTFLKAAAVISKTRSDIDFICVGNGTDAYRSELNELINNLDLGKRIIWVNEQNNINAVYNALDVCCLCSISEGFPNVVAEAMACGVTCVVTDVGDAAIIVGDLGYVVQPSDPNALAEAILMSLSHRKSQVDKETMRNKIVNVYSLENLYERTEHVLEFIKINHCTNIKYD